MQVKGEPSSSSSHVVLQRLQGSRRQGETETELPRIGEEDIDNVIGSREFIISLSYRIKINTEEKAKVIASVWGKNVFNSLPR